MNKKRFLKEVSRQLEALYRATKAGVELGPKAKHRCEGFMQAGEFLQIVSKDELTEVMELAHKKVFSETIVHRKERLRRKHRWPVETIDYSEFESPAYDRRS